jgi:HD superfamily phosphohydrolase
MRKSLSPARPLKLIRDPIHGEVAVPEEDLPLLDSPGLQRLRRVRQIGLGALVYPGANHTRFEHSIGAMKIAGNLGERMGLGEEERRMVRISALAHDLGHGPFSHTSEKFAWMASGLDHTKLTEREILKGRTSEVLTSMDLDPGEIATIAGGGDSQLGRLLHSQVGVDRMDYLMRDAHYTGVAYGVIDYERIMSTLVFHGGEVVIREKGIQAAESLLVARFLMYHSVYLHHVSRIADSMMLRALEELTDAGTSVPEIMAADDLSLVSALRDEGGLAGAMMERILDRELFKRAVYLSRGQAPDLDELLKIGGSRPISRALEDGMSQSAGLPRGSVLVDGQSRPPADELGIRILADGAIHGLEDRSPLVRSLKEAHWNYWRFGVYCSEENLGQVREVCQEHGWEPMGE